MHLHSQWHIVWLSPDWRLCSTSQLSCDVYLLRLTSARSALWRC